MSQLIPIIALVTGLLTGGAVVWWFCRHRALEAANRVRTEIETEGAVLTERLNAQSQNLSDARVSLKSLTEKLESCSNENQQLASQNAALTVAVQERLADNSRAEEELGDLKADLVEMRAQFGDSQTSVTRLTTTLDAERTETAKGLALIEHAKQNLADAFKALASEALQTNNQSFLGLAKAALETHQTEAKGDLDKRQVAIDQLVKPLHESLKNVDAKIAELEKSRAEAYGSLTQQVLSLISTEEKLRSETSNLVKALRAPHVRGRWGELQLRRVVEMAGMIDHCDFYEQESVNTDEGRVRPDLRVQLPGNANIVVDSKVPLVAFIEAMEAVDDEARTSKLKDHARHVADRISELGRKAYWEQFLPSPEFVVLFLPGEHFYTAALEYQPDLIERGVEQKVIVATPMTLISLLRAVAIGWRHQRLAANAEEVSKLGRELYERIVKLSEHFVGLGKNIRQTVEAYNRTTATLESRVLVSARRFRDLGAAGGDEIETLSSMEALPRTIQATEFVALFPADETAECSKLPLISSDACGLDMPSAAAEMSAEGDMPIE